MKQRNIAFITLAVVIAVLLIAAIVTMAGAWKSNSTPRPCLSSLRPNDLQTLNTYAASVPGGIETARTIADEVDVICVIESTDLDEGTATTHYYEDDDGFEHFLPYALATAHARHISGNLQVTGTPDDAQFIALCNMMLVRPDGKIYQAYDQQGIDWLRQENSYSSLAHPATRVTQVTYGDAAPIKIKTAFNQTPPKDYYKGTIPGSGGASNTFDNVRVAALTIYGSDDDKRTNPRPGIQPSVAPSNIPKGSPTPASSRANPATPKARRS